ncbi:AAA domain family protein [Mycobacterium xenopi 3993]|nr:AAA domain family protein [Mycobacterium xenopi 3993]
MGKTELSKALAEFLFGDDDALIQIDMGEFHDRFTASRLFGAPPGYVGYEEGGS